MGGVLNNFLTSGHFFAENDNLQRFRFSLLNSLLLIAAFFTLLNYFASIFDFVPFAPLYEKTLLFYTFSCIFSIYLLRKKKGYYLITVNNIVISSLILFYMALFTVLHDEFRLIWFFLVVFASFVLMGKRYGIILTLLLLLSIIIINKFVDLGFSELAHFTFINSFLVFAAFSYFFLEKIEKDALEFKILNNKLEDKVTTEIQQRKEQEQMLLRQSRMANMGEMLDSIAHQWRQPLMHINSILMNMDNALNTNHALDTNKTKDKGKEYIDKKIDEVAMLTAHMSQTIEDFRGLFKVEKEQTQFTLESAISDVLTLMKNSFNNIEIYYKIHDETLISAHRSELIQVIIILLSNAVEVLNKRDIQNKLIIIESTTVKNLVSFSIEDNAGGITSENLETIFDPYFTTKEQSGGTGLGLYLAKIIVEQKMLGKITAMNTAGGARFKIVLSNYSKQREEQ